MENTFKYLSFFIVLFFLLNIFSLTGIFDMKSFVVEGSAIEQFYSAVSMPSDIIGKMMSQKAQDKTPYSKADNKESKKDSAVMSGYAVSAATSVTMLFWSFVLCVGGKVVNGISPAESYPLKVPWRGSIFLILIMKLLFNIRPRAGDIYAYNYTIKKACVK